MGERTFVLCFLDKGPRLPLTLLDAHYPHGSCRRRWRGLPRGHTGVTATRSPQHLCVSPGGHPPGSLTAEPLLTLDMGTWKSFSILFKNKIFQRKSSPRADAFPRTLSRQRQGRQTYQTPGRACGGVSLFPQRRLHGLLDQSTTQCLPPKLKNIPGGPSMNNVVSVKAKMFSVHLIQMTK